MRRVSEAERGRRRSRGRTSGARQVALAYCRARASGSGEDAQREHANDAASVRFTITGEKKVVALDGDNVMQALLRQQWGCVCKLEAQKW
jgi:hypothetical protein